MGKYEATEINVFSVFDSAEWKAEAIKTYPTNFIAVNPGNEYIRVSIIPSGKGVNLVSLSGVIIVDIFTSAGNGPRRTSTIADKLDQYLVGKSLETVSGATLQLKNSTLALVGVDPDNTSLYRSTYTIPFNLFGVN